MLRKEKRKVRKVKNHLGILLLSPKEQIPWFAIEDYKKRANVVGGEKSQKLQKLPEI